MAVPYTFANRTEAIPLAELDANFQFLDLDVNGFYRNLAGMDPEKLSTNVLRIQPGSCAKSDGSSLASISGNVDINMAVVGVNGIDVGAPVDGLDYFPYMIQNDTTGALAGVLSNSKFYNTVVVPAGYTMFRKLPFGFRYSLASWDGIPNFHLSFWPKPFIRFTDAQEAIEWRALLNGANAGFTDVDLSPWIPDNARIAYILTRVSSGGAVAGYGKIRTVANNGLAVGGSTPGGVDTYCSMWIRVTSALKIQYAITNDARLSIFVMGYGMTEPS